MVANRTLLLDTVEWDLVLDANGNIAVAAEPYSLAQDAASAIRTYLGECYLDDTVGVPYLTQVFGVPTSLAAIKQQLVAAANTVPDVDPAQTQVFITALAGRAVSGQVQVTSATTGQTQAASFSTLPLQGA